MGKELNLNYSHSYAKEKSILTDTETFLWIITKVRSITASETMAASLLHINTMPLSGICMLFLDSSTAYEPFSQARSASALHPILSAVATHKFVSVKKGKSCSLAVMSRTWAVCLHTMHVRCAVSVCVVGDREMCVCASEWRKERSDKATERGVGPRMVRQRKR